MLTDDMKAQVLDRMGKQVAALPAGATVSTAALYFGGQYTPPATADNPHPMPVSMMGTIDYLDLPETENEDLLAIDAALDSAAARQGRYLDRSRFAGLVTGMRHSLEFTVFEIAPDQMDCATVNHVVFEFEGEGTGWEFVALDRADGRASLRCFGFAPRCDKDATPGLPVEVGTSNWNAVVEALQEAGVLGWEASYAGEHDAATETRAWSLLVSDGAHCLTSKGGNDAPAGFATLLGALEKLGFHPGL